MPPVPYPTIHRTGKMRTCISVPKCGTVGVLDRGIVEFVRLVLGGSLWINPKFCVEFDHDSSSLIWYDRRVSGPVILTFMPIDAFKRFPYGFCIAEKS